MRGPFSALPLFLARCTKPMVVKGLKRPSAPSSWIGEKARGLKGSSKRMHYAVKRNVNTTLPSSFDHPTRFVRALVTINIYRYGERARRTTKRTHEGYDAEDPRWKVDLVKAGTRAIFGRGRLLRFSSAVPCSVPAARSEPLMFRHFSRPLLWLTRDRIFEKSKQRLSLEGEGWRVRCSNPRRHDNGGENVFLRCRCVLQHRSRSSRLDLCTVSL